MIDPLEWLWPLADATFPTVAVHHTESWPVDVHDRLLAEGFLFEDTLADRVLCPECQDHYEEVLACDGPGRGTDSFIPCPVLYRVRLPQDSRRQWSVNFSVLAQALAASMTLTGKVTELLPRRVWRLGRTKWHDATRDVLFARGLHWSDAATMRGSITQARKPIVFVPRGKPAMDLWTGRVPPVIALDDIATLTEVGIEIERLEIAAALQDADVRQGGEGVSKDSTQLALMIRRQIKAENKTELTDDVLVAAFRQQGSLRKAAQYLTDETGATISKDSVQRAVARAGGIAEVRETSDSDSIVRPGGPHTRDRKGKRIVLSKDETKQ